jgi:hypothetical protein
MISLRFSRQQTETVLYSFIPIMELYAETRVNNLAVYDVSTDATIHALVVKLTITEVENMLIDKLKTTRGHNISFRMPYAEALIFYRELLRLPVDKYYSQQVRKEWIEAIESDLAFYRLLSAEKKIAS